MRRLVLVFVVVLASGCRGVIVDHVPIVLHLPGAPACRQALGTMSMTALGDFPTRDIDVVPIDLSGAPLSPITQFPTTTRAVSVAVPAASGVSGLFGWATLDSLALDASLVLRPVGVSCPLADPEARLPEGAAIAVIDDARVMFVGGLDDSGQATRRVAVLHTREETVQLPAVARAVPIAFAAATLVPGTNVVVVSGGALTAGGAARDTWESIRLDPGMAVLGALDVPRRDHASIGVALGGAQGVLIVGGTDGRAMLRTIEWIDPTRGIGRVLGSQLVTPRLRPMLVALDATRIAIVGGVDASGASVPSIEVLDVAADAIRPLALAPPDWFAALPSGRIAWAAAGSLSIVDVRSGQVIAGVAALPALVAPIAVAMRSGRVLVEGRQPDGSRAAFRVDPGSGTVAPVTASRVPRRLVALADGVTLELAASGASLRLDETLTPFDSPPPMYLFAADRSRLALDASTQWIAAGGALTLAATVDAARLDVPVLRFARFDARIDATGAWDLVLTGEQLETLATIAVTDDTIALGPCSFPRTSADGRVLVTRGATGDLVVGSERGSGTCRQRESAARVGIGIVAHRSASLRSLTLARGVGGP